MDNAKTVEELLTENEELRTQIDKLEEDVEDARDERDSADADAEEAVEQRDEANAENARLRDEMQTLVADKELLLKLVGLSEHEFDANRSRLEMHGLNPHHGGRQ